MSQLSAEQISVIQRAPADKMSYRQKPYSLGKGKDRIKLAPSNGGSFVSGTGNIQFEIGCNQPNKYADFSNAYISMDITNNDATACYFNQHLGAIAFQQKLTWETSNNTKITELEGVNVKMDIDLSRSVDADWYQSNGSQLFGTGVGSYSGADGGTAYVEENGIEGKKFATGGSKRYIMPLTESSFCNGTLVPMAGIEFLRLRVDLEDANVAMIAGTDGLTATQFSFSNVLLHYDVIELDVADAMAITGANNNMFMVSGNEYYHQAELIPYSSTSVNMKISVAKRKAKKIIGCIRSSGKATDDMVDSFARNKSGVTKIVAKYNSIPVGQTDLSVTASGFAQSAEVFAEALKISQGGLMSMHTSALGEVQTLALIDGTPNDTSYLHTDVFNLQHSLATDTSTCGKFFFEIDLSSGLGSENVVSGISTMSGMLTLEITKAASGATPGDQLLDVFVEYEQDNVLDMSKGNTWQVYN